MKGWRLEKTARRATGAGALGGRAPHERTVAGAPPRLQGARTTPPPACASTRSAGTPCGSGCHGLRFGPSDLGGASPRLALRIPHAGGKAAEI